MTATSEMSTAAARPLGVGEVINTTVRVVRRNLQVLLFLGLFWVLLPEVVLGLLIVNAGVPANSTNIVSTLLQMIFTGAATHAVLADLEGRVVDFRQSQSVGLKLFLPLWGISILTGIGIILGLLLLIVPGVILALVWFVSVPARVVEGPGVRAAISRSAALTKGYRWPIFLVFLIALAAAAVLILVMGALMFAAGTESAISAVVLTPLMACALGIIMAAFPPVLYVRLREIKEGGGAVQVAEIFD